MRYLCSYIYFKVYVCILENNVSQHLSTNMKNSEHEHVDEHEHVVEHGHVVEREHAIYSEHYSRTSLH